MVLRKGSTVELLENFVKGLVGMEAGERSGERSPLRGERVDFWVELGAIRGLWDDL
ncbi:hypothetical protein CK203_042786 [Vitis vinifera]|uniref:Uncharacterized protein n=1 Tax=Vitis vinifera TaxID=29760 RepID=A0A438HQP7_VITVI|nr:hypothetical protein CK203_042786 [Vitis vinifera]